MADKRICSIPGCGKRHYGRGFCVIHHHGFRKGLVPKRPAAPKGSTAKFIAMALTTDQDDCVLWPFARNIGGYAKWKHPTGGSESVSRHICEIVNGPPTKPHLLSLHSCNRGHLGCINPRHLRWGTSQENANDRIKDGTTTRGAGGAKLTAMSVVDMRRRAEAGQTLISISAIYGVSSSHVSDIVRRERWSWLE